MHTSKLFNYQVVLLILFIVLAIAVDYYPINSVDIGVSLFIQQFRNSALDKVMIAVSYVGKADVAFGCMSAVALLFYLFTLKREALAIMAVAFTGIITFVLKRMVNRPRPTATNVQLIESYQNQSFPSGHTLSYFVFFGFLILLMQHLKAIPKYIRYSVNIISFFMLIAGPLSRIYLGAHWFTDILGGMIVGLMYLQCLNYYYRKA